MYGYHMVLLGILEVALLYDLRTVIRRSCSVSGEVSRHLFAQNQNICIEGNLYPYLLEIQRLPSRGNVRQDK
jgi:hypothetical protein